MAINDSGTRNQYTASASQTVFAYTFEIFATGDIKVEQNGAVITAYTVSNVGVDTGGNVTLTTGATAGDIITIYRDMALERLTDYAQNGDFLADDVNNDYNRLWAALQQNNNNLGASIRPAISDSALNSTNTELANVATRAGKSLGFDSTGLLEYNSVSVVDGDTKFTTKSVMENDTGATVGTTTYVLSDRASGIFDVVTVGSTPYVDLPNTYSIIVSAVDATKCFVLRVDGSANVGYFGATGDGATDDSLAIQAAIDYVDNTGGGQVDFPSSSYIVTQTILHKKNVKLLGLGSSSNEIPDLATNRGATLQWSGSVNLIIDDDASADNTGDWSVVDCTLNFSVDHYTVDYSSATQYVYQTVAVLTEGNQYRISYKLKDGTASGVTVDPYFNTALGAGSYNLPSAVTTSEWKEHTHIITATAGIDTIQIFSTMTTGNYQIKDLVVVEVDRVLYEENAQHGYLEGINIVGNRTSSNKSAIVGVDIQSIDAISLNSRRGVYKNFSIKDCYHGVSMSSLFLDSGNTDGYLFENFDIVDCYTCVYTNSNFIAYTEFKSGKLSYERYGLDYERASWIFTTSVAGHCTITTPEVKAAFVHITNDSGVLTFINCQSETTAGQTNAFFAIFDDAIEGAATKLNATTFIGNLLQQESSIYNKQENLCMIGNSISKDFTFYAGSEGSVLDSTANKEIGGSFLVDTGIEEVYINRRPVFNEVYQFTWNPASIADGASATTVETVPNVIKGDMVLSSYGGDLAGLQLTAYASDTDEVTFLLTNNSGGAIDLATNSWWARVIKKDAL